MLCDPLLSRLLAALVLWPAAVAAVALILIVCITIKPKGPMKYLLITLCFLCFLLFNIPATAADPPSLGSGAASPGALPLDPPTPLQFRAGEFNLELGGTATLRNESRSKDDLNFGGGLGANYWFTRGLGLGLRAEAEDTHGAGVDRALLRVSVRAPLWDTVAPYGYLDGGYDFEVDRSLAGAGGGLEWRPGPVLQGRLGLYIEAGLNVDPKGNGWMRGAAGIRLPF